MSKEQAKSLFIAGENITSISTVLGISRATVYAYKKRDLEAGVDWDELKFIKATDKADAITNEQEFVATLINQFEKALEGLDEVEPQKRVEMLSKYVGTYYKLKQQKDNVKVNQADIVKETIQTLSQLALNHKANEVIQFLADHAETIVSEVLKNK
ncbi:hypothetical protein TW81_09845 [Vibrio galatheae]|uniref:Uncharacterized protein n=1 Tax=Vibrio galatheae TaxID=579748 RepID=A0A0F4NK83_9VIBR|nr:DUF1804 family protein [Vibrio galatheae]KJY83289.1 hypothetical protein TW81_09845 [Vibrio galatheae]